MIAAVIIISAGAVLGTLAWLSDGAKKVENTFDPSQVTCEIEEYFDRTDKKDIKVKNTSDIDAYIRVALACNYVDSSGNIIKPAQLPTGLTLGTNWIKGADGFYYYVTPMAPTDLTNNLFNETITNSDGLQITILAEAIQADGKSGGKSPAELSWGSAVTGIDASGNLQIKTS